MSTTSTGTGRMSMGRQTIGLVGWILLTFATAALGARASISAASFYGTLELPAWAPAASVFGPAWTVLYALMAIAAWVVWREGGWARQRTALVVFVIQLAVNALWSWLFFAWHRGALAFVDIMVLWGLIVVTLLMFWRVKPLAGVLLVPYLAWVSFAAALNFTVWRMNPTLLG